jgi:hypothetical protein
MRHKLLTAIVKYDARLSKKPHYNVYTLSHACNALTRAMNAVDRGVTPREALCGTFCGRLLDACLKAIGESPSTREEQRGMWCAKY